MKINYPPLPPQIKPKDISGVKCSFNGDLFMIVFDCHGFNFELMGEHGPCISAGQSVEEWLCQHHGLTILLSLLSKSPGPLTYKPIPPLPRPDLN